MPTQPPAKPFVDARHAHLEALYRRTDAAARVATDPVRFVRRYATPRDQEVAAILAAGLAFGRVDLFGPVLARIFAVLDDHGGPAAAAARLPARAADALDAVQYRWTRGPDVRRLVQAIGRATGGGPVEALFEGPGDVRARLTRAIHALRAAASPLTVGTRHLLPDPLAGSACKRWNLALRWLVRPPTEGVDLGVWTTLRPADLIMPVDTHVARLATFLGLTARPDPTWRGAEAITAGLRAYDPEDPVRFDFALAHLGISGACLGHRAPAVCVACPLDAVCRAPPGAP